MVIAAASGDRVTSCAIRDGIVSGTAFECVIPCATASWQTDVDPALMLIVAASADDLLESCDHIVTGLGAVGGSGAEVSRDALGGRGIIQSVPPGAAIVGIIGCVGRSHDMVVASIALDRVGACSV